MATAHLGVIQVGNKVEWTEGVSTRRGRVRQVVHADGSYWVYVDPLPYTSRRRLVAVLLQHLTRLP